MKSHDYVPADTLPKPGWLGRCFRLFLGIIVLLSAFSVGTHFDQLAYAREIPTSIGLWLLAAVLFFSMREVIDLGLNVQWGLKAQFVTLGLFIAGIAADVILFSRLWAPPVGIFFCIWFLLIASPLGVAFVLAALWGTPGCEMRTFASILARLEGHSASEHYCPGGIDFIDYWELHLRKK